MGVAAAEAELHRAPWEQLSLHSPARHLVPLAGVVLGGPSGRTGAEALQLGAPTPF